ncbi:PfkB family carbohydrate kinase [uncultured Jannaschia sp.]|uniref:PfkB family carbohydrate kinase n=1 Tax=uncultured Jannaschia sp. TaxID=293347 RepID=UPI002634A5E7|nr:PfkB family carbohydrate kinase [uncultured Jannaschia sp.]
MCSSWTRSAPPVATLDRDGAVVLRAGCGTLHLPTACDVEGADVTGAGEIFAAALALALTLAAGAGIAVAARLACAAAGVAVAKPGTATCSAAELRAALAGQVVRPLPACCARRGRRRHSVGRRVRRIVFTMIASTSCTRGTWRILRRPARSAIC